MIFTQREIVRASDLGIFFAFEMTRKCRSGSGAVRGQLREIIELSILLSKYIARIEMIFGD
jgi:hypothetical protein